MSQNKIEWFRTIVIYIILEHSIFIYLVRNILFLEYYYVQRMCVMTWRLVASHRSYMHGNSYFSFNYHRADSVSICTCDRHLEEKLCNLSLFIANCGGILYVLALIQSSRPLICEGLLD